MNINEKYGKKSKKKIYKMAILGNILTFSLIKVSAS
jgi:hypothetical protein